MRMLTIQFVPWVGSANTGRVEQAIAEFVDEHGGIVTWAWCIESSENLITRDFDDVFEKLMKDGYAISAVKLPVWSRQGKGKLLSFPKKKKPS